MKKIEVNVFKGFSNRKKNLLLIGILTAAVLLIGILCVRRVHSSGKGKSSNQNRSYTVAAGNVSSTVSATGSISLDDSTDVTVAVGVMVKEVLVESGDEVKKGDILAKLDKTSVVSELIEAKETKEDLEDQLDDDDLSDLEEEMIEGELEEIEDRISALTKLHKNPVIKATADGVISEIYISAGSETSNTTANVSDDSQSSDSSSKSLTSSTAGAAGTASTASAATGNAATVSTAASTYTAQAVRTTTTGFGIAQAVRTTTAGSGTIQASRLSTNTSDSGEGTGNGAAVITDLSGIHVTTPAAGQTAQTSISSSDTYTGTISWSPNDGTFKADTAYTATISLTAKDGYIFSGNYEGGSVSDAGKHLKLVYTFDKTEASENTKESETSEQTQASGTDVEDSSQADSTQNTDSASAAQDNNTEENKSLNQTDSSQNNQNNKNQQSSSNNQQSSSDSKATAGNQTGTPGNGSGSNQGISVSSGNRASGSGGGTGISLGSASGSSSSSSATSSSGSSSSYYGSYEGAAFSINTMDQAVITVSVDELDILSIEKGQTAKVTLDALSDQEFEGTITKVSNTSSSTNGNAKYSVEISVPYADQMMDGMSASVVIVTDSAEDALLLPVLALQERGDQAFVYTSQEEDGTLSGEKEVETGLSDGTNVEIVSGLSEGDTVYYAVSSGDDSQNLGNFMMQGGGLGQGGRPDGGSDNHKGPGGNGGNSGGGIGGPGGGDR